MNTIPDAVGAILRAIREPEGAIVLTGPPGGGKTQVLEQALGSLRGDHVQVVRLLTSGKEPLNLRRMMAQVDGFGTGRGEPAVLVESVFEVLLGATSVARHIVLGVDDAHALQPDTLNHLELMARLAASDGLLLQLVLVGRPELWDLLRHESLRPLFRRVRIHHVLETAPPSARPGASARDGWNPDPPPAATERRIVASDPWSRAWRFQHVRLGVRTGRVITGLLAAGLLGWLLVRPPSGQMPPPASVAAQMGAPLQIGGGSVPAAAPPAASGAPVAPVVDPVVPPVVAPVVVPPSSRAAVPPAATIAPDPPPPATAAPAVAAPPQAPTVPAAAAAAAQPVVVPVESPPPGVPPPAVAPTAPATGAPTATATPIAPVQPAAAPVAPPVAALPAPPRSPAPVAAIAPAAPRTRGPAGTARGANPAATASVAATPPATPPPATTPLATTPVLTAPASTPPVLTAPATRRTSAPPESASAAARAGAAVGTVAVSSSAGTDVVAPRARPVDRADPAATNVTRIEQILAEAPRPAWCDHAAPTTDAARAYVASACGK